MNESYNCSNAPDLFLRNRKTKLQIHWREEKMRFLSILALALSLLPVVAQPAAAQAVPPLGRWASAAGNVLVVNDDATCAYQTAQLRVQGNCSWRGSSPTDGFCSLDALRQASQQLRQMDVSVHWINRERILVLGEPFQRR